VSSIEQQLPSIATLRAVAALRSPHLALVRPARIGLGFETMISSQRSLAQVESVVGGPGRLALPYSLRLLLDAMAGLGTLHRAFGFVHGEVQPEHVLLGNDGVGRLLPVVRAHWVRGEERRPERLYYLAPEKLLGDHVDARSDVFSVGVLLWEAVSGRRLLDATEVEAIIARLMSGGIPRAQAPEEEAWAVPLSSIAERALSVNPAQRFATLAEMKDAIEQVSLRYLASTPGMAEVFVDPSRHVRGGGERAPDSQRITLPPHQAPPTIKPRPSSQPPPQQVKPAGVGVSDYLDEELTTKPNASPLPIAARRPHVNTLVGNAPPFAVRESLPHASAPSRLAHVSPSVPVLITPLPKPPANPVDLVTARARPRSTTPVSFPPPPANPPSGRVEPQSRRAASLSPLVTARPPSSQAPSFESSFEPSFELLRPRRRRAPLWLALVGAAAAVALFAARPWLFEPAPESLHEASSAAPAASEAPHAALPPPPVVESTETAPKPRVAGAAPSGVRPTPRPRAPREEHVVIPDTIDPSIQALREPAPAATPEPAASPEPAPPPPPPPPPAPAPAKAKPAATPDADRYGI
jgi:hypothetical protein